MGAWPGNIRFIVGFELTPIDTEPEQATIETSLI